MKMRLALAVGLLLFVTTLPAATIIHGTNFPGSVIWPVLPTAGDTVPLAISGTTLSLPKFDSLSGTLNSVTLTLDSYVDLTITFTNTTDRDQEVSDSSGRARVGVTGPAATFLQSLPAIPFVSSLIVPVGATQRNGSGSASSGPVFYNGSTVLSAFSAPSGGWIDFTLDAHGEQGSITPTGVSATASGSVNGTLTVTYDYTPNSPTPEPTTLMLFGSALLAIGFSWRRN